MTKHNWDSLHDVLFDLTSKEYTQLELEEFFDKLPVGLKAEGIEWGMSDTLWRDKVIDYYKSESKKSDDYKIIKSKYITSEIQKLLTTIEDKKINIDELIDYIQGYLS